ncbi:hypothetical protein Murmansk-038 [Murmansk poxvirus]|uniref:Ig-like domain-containing protein n=1 Tax=Murmansk poxvirus TaxID=2025359 RepID=A0A223FML7_9POXV|nr:hypothetical protein CKM52_gp038 [Murmansk poxvirus]AST09233.1 hypothetical protein Murmansk-038 [Murmansk poxvirus]
MYCLSLLLFFISLIMIRAEKGNSLLYYNFIMSRPDREPRFGITGFVNSVQFMRYDSDSGTPMKAYLPWMEKESYWENETRIAKYNEQIFRKNLNTLMKYYKQKNDSYHVLQSLYGCEMVNGRFSAYYHYAYDFKDYIIISRTPDEFYASDNMARITLQKWKQSGVIDRKITYIKSKCIESLRRYLDKDNETFRSYYPDTYMILYPGPTKDKVVMKCCAINFRGSISIQWIDENNNKLTNYEMIEARPSGDGKFQKYSSIMIPFGKEHKYTCEVHTNNGERITLKLNPPNYTVNIKQLYIIIVYITFTITIIAVIFMSKKITISNMNTKINELPC